MRCRESAITVDMDDDVADADRCMRVRAAVSGGGALDGVQRGGGAVGRGGAFTGGGVVSEAVRPDSGDRDSPLTCETKHTDAVAERTPWFGDSCQSSGRAQVAGRTFVRDIEAEAEPVVLGRAPDHHVVRDRLVLAA